MSDDVRDHWSSHPNWRPGRSFYTWHVIFPDDPALLGLQAAYQQSLRSLTGISLVPAELLHLTMQGIGFADRVPESDLELIVTATRRRLDHVQPFEIGIEPAIVDAESLQLPVTPANRLRRLQAHLRSSINDIWGTDSVPQLPELQPHISLGYWNKPAPAGPIRRHMDAAGGEIAATQLTDVSLLELRQEDQRYVWTVRATVPLGLRARAGDTGAQS
ncbi:2'-5' RNA ligase family protein [Kribbella sp. NPDC059898]|uniref:2'-5' RNA ligase family protein n=1 Tax=Kribbella sp. NPDC059898 TaxID=3346995 RepID=UPI00366512C1